MLVNFSPCNDSLAQTISCLLSGTTVFIYTASLIISICVILPLCMCILYVGLREWQQKSSTASESTSSHSDSFTYHTVVVQLIGVFRCALCLYGVFKGDKALVATGTVILTLTVYGEIFFQALVCGECYLAVVHPITYMSLRNEKGVRIRNISIGCVWVMSLIGMGLVTIESIIVYVDFILLTTSFATVIICNVFALYALAHLGSRFHGRGRERVDKSKRRAFYTILIIFTMLVIRCSWSLVWTLITMTGRNIDCIMMTLEALYYLPGSLVSPLIFLCKRRKCLFKQLS